MLYLDGMRIAESTGSAPIPLDSMPRGAFLNIGQHQTSRDDSSVEVGNHFLGQLGHLDMWDFHIRESQIIAYAKGPSSESGNVVPWAVVRNAVSDGIDIIYPSSCRLKGKKIYF